MSRQIVRMIDATPEVEVAGRLVNLTEGREAVLDGRIYAAVLIPPVWSGICSWAAARKSWFSTTTS